METAIASYLIIGVILATIGLPDIQNTIVKELTKINEENNKARRLEGTVLLYLLFTILWLPAIIINLVKR